ncbi:MAG: hypothetical protein OER88_00325 [Planctomycetota bacterium]|nr:hypothetical protein [Planctomycetota bacterium]
MRRLALFVLLAACTTTVRDLPPDMETDARIAGQLDFGGSKIGRLIRVQHEDGREFVLRPEHDTFVMALPAGRYEILNFGGYRLAEDRIIFDAEKDRTSYVGSFQAVRGGEGELRIAVRDELDAVARSVTERYPELTVDPALAHSTLAPLEPDQDLVVKLERIETPVYVSFGVGYYGYYHRPYHGRHRRHYHPHYHYTYYCP